MKKVLIGALLIMSIASCTEQQRAKQWGSSATIELKSGQRLVNVTWKQDDMWLLVKQDTTKPTSYVFQESSSWGILQGEVTIIEKQ